MTSNISYKRPNRTITISRPSSEVRKTVFVQSSCLKEPLQETRTWNRKPDSWKRLRCAKTRRRSSNCVRNGPFLREITRTFSNDMPKPPRCVFVSLLSVGTSLYLTLVRAVVASSGLITFEANTRRLRYRTRTDASSWTSTLPRSRNSRGGTESRPKRRRDLWSRSEGAPWRKGEGKGEAKGGIHEGGAYQETSPDTDSSAHRSAREPKDEDQETAARLSRFYVRTRLACPSYYCDNLCFQR